MHQKRKLHSFNTHLAQSIALNYLGFLYQNTFMLIFHKFYLPDKIPEDVALFLSPN